MLSGNSENFRRPSMVSIKMLASSAFKGKTPGEKSTWSQGKLKISRRKFRKFLV